MIGFVGASRRDVSTDVEECGLFSLVAAASIMTFTAEAAAVVSFSFPLA